MINVKNIHKSFGKNDILRGIDLSVKRGEVVVILGASGSGKTTFLRCLNALEIPQQGSIEFGVPNSFSIDFSKGASKKSIYDLRRKSTMVFQQYNLFAHKTVLENVIEGPLIVQKKEKAIVITMAKKLLEDVGLQDKLNHYPHELSGGQQQRVGIARAMAMQPELILFDEPTSALDPELVGEVLGVMKRLALSGNTMIIVTHEIAFAREVADRIMFIDQGKVVEIGQAKSLIDDPQHKRTQQFLQKLVPSR